ncbi:hypothetical protein AVEN_198408-1, partial [Araneus ventricosus]
RPSPRVRPPTEKKMLYILDARGRKSDFVHCLYALAGYNGMVFTPWVTLPGEKTPDVHRPFHPGPPPPPR